MRNKCLLRTVGFNNPQVSWFLSEFKHVMQKCPFVPSRIFSTDATGISFVHTKSAVLSVRVKRHTGKSTSGERSQCDIVLRECHWIPCLFIFLWAKFTSAPAVAVAVLQQDGWMNIKTFLAWMKEFVDGGYPLLQDPVFLILDGHCSYKDLQVIRDAQNTCIHDFIYLRCSRYTCIRIYVFPTNCTSVG